MVFQLISNQFYFENFIANLLPLNTMQKIIQTKRLILRPWKEGDFAPFATIVASTKVNGKNKKKILLEANL